MKQDVQILEVLKQNQMALGRSYTPVTALVLKARHQKVEMDGQTLVKRSFSLELIYRNSKSTNRLCKTSMRWETPQEGL